MSQWKIGSVGSGPNSAEGRPRWDQVTNIWLLGYPGEAAGPQLRSVRR